MKTYKDLIIEQKNKSVLFKLNNPLSTADIKKFQLVFGVNIENVEGEDKIMIAGKPNKVDNFLQIYKSLQGFVKG
jgi:hypothetical protein